MSINRILSISLKVALVIHLVHAFALVTSAQAQGTTKVVSFFSKDLQTDKAYTIWLPPGYDTPGNEKKYPVIYSLQNTSFRSYVDGVVVKRDDWKHREVIMVQYDPGGGMHLQ